MQRYTRSRSMGSGLLVACATLVSLSLTTLITSDARAQIKPYFLVIVDTSSSMSWCAPGQSDCSCHTGNNCGNAFAKNTCGFDKNRIGDAKCALQRIIDSTGDATFGLMQFKHDCSDVCVQPGTTPGGTCDAQLVVDIKSNNSTLMREWVDGRCNRTPSDTPAGTATCATEGFTHELTTGRGTPIGKSLVRANEYLRGSVAPGAAWVYPTNPAGMNKAVASPIAGDSKLACRPVSVILLTDGAESCGGDGAAAAADLYAGDVKGTSLTGKAFRTYVIGFGTSTSSGAEDNYNPAALDAIATAGGTDAMSAGGHKFFPAADEDELSVALNQIIADAQAPVEICNGEDDDCDGKIDEGLQKYCDKPGGHTKADLCTDPGEAKCDGKDDNCDGLIDNGFMGVCSTCTSSDKEVCDGVDNDCDQKIDEDTSSLGPCGTDKGECEFGELECIGGQESCEGGVGPKKETCDCKDNDCDGNVDEDASGSELCGGEQRCAGCSCVDFCDTTAEFSATCNDKKLTPEFQNNGECLCVVSTCDAAECATKSVMRDNVLVCSPSSNRVSPCMCRGGDCGPRCDGTTCASGQACDPRNGRCVENNCRGLGCDAGKLCEPVSGECQLDKCANTKCKDDQVCRGGECETSCAEAESKCGDGERCTQGKCVVDKCAATSCGLGKSCNADTGKCMDNMCSGVACKTGQMCEQATGTCIADPCWDVSCPKLQVCQSGECVFGGNNPITSPGSGDAQSLLATGGGGCTCSVPGTTHGRGVPPSAAIFALGLLGVGLRRRRLARSAGASRGARALLFFVVVAALALLGAGCRNNTFCPDCKQKASDLKDNDKDNDKDGGKITLEDGRVVDPGELDGGGAGSGGAAGGNSGGSGGSGGDPMPTCKKTGEEECDGKDNDCDFKVDEDTTAAKNDCLQAGVCAHTKPVCMNGKFVCKYSSSLYEADEVTCDGEDNDCDSMVDEAFPKLGDACQVGVGECRVTGTQQCKMSGTGLSCVAGTPKKPSNELCDGKDNDCDGLVDEPSTNKGSNPSFVDQANVGSEVCDGKDNDCDGNIDEGKSGTGINPSFVPEDVVKITKTGGGDVWVYRYEASRVDATGSSEGSISARPCSRANVLPWTNVTYTEAKAACEMAGLKLCKLADWIDACKAGSKCGWAYTPATGTCDDTNGQDDTGDYVVDGSDGCVEHDVTAAPGSPDADALAPTGSMPECYANQPNGHIFDLSGNAKEWTTDPASGGSPDKNPLRGGSYNNAPAGLRCDFDFSVGGPDLRLPNIGFRCCSDTDPN